MNPLSPIKAQEEIPSIKVAKADLLAAWSILENLAVSLDQIGGFFGESADGRLDERKRLASLETLKNYLSPELINRINEARILLGNYVEDSDAEALSDTIRYWDYATSRE
jgi:hypothetical protein